MPTEHSSHTALRHRWRHWWIERLARSDTFVITQRNLYVLPTRAGLMLGLTLLLLLVASINYQLNLGYLLTFLLAGCSAVALHVTHRNLHGLQLKLAPIGPVYAGRPMVLEVDVQAPGPRPRYALSLGCIMGSHTDDTWIDVPAQANSVAGLTFPAPQRGWCSLPAIRVQSRFPMGIFRVWTWWRPATSVLVYPEPESQPPRLPMGSDDEGLPSGVSSLQNDELDNLRPWRRGDPLNRVVWKKAAKDPDPSNWVSRDGQDTTTQQIWLTPLRCGVSGKEAQMSRLCAWVLEAEERGLEYGLKLPTQTIPIGRGASHRHQCLEALALC